MHKEIAGFSAIFPSEGPHMDRGFMNHFTLEFWGLCQFFLKNDWKYGGGRLGCTVSSILVVHLILLDLRAKFLFHKC